MSNKNLMDKAQDMGYKGDSNTEAAAWINAVEKGLDMSEEARYERAKEMGFNIDEIYHHGTKHQFDRFDKSKIGMNYTYSENSGFFFTKKLISAQNYARLHSKDESDGRVLSVFLKFKNPYITSTNSDYWNPADRFDISGHEMMHEVRLEKKDAILIKGTRNDDLCVVLDPSQILSIHAAFDPETESYKPSIDLEETLDDLMLDFNLAKGKGLKELDLLVKDYSEQEKKTKDEIKKDFYIALNEDGYDLEDPMDVEYVDKVKKCFDNAIDKLYDKNEQKKKKRIKFRK